MLITFRVRSFNTIHSQYIMQINVYENIKYITDTMIWTTIRCSNNNLLIISISSTCFTQSSAPEGGRNYRPKHVELIEIISKLLLLHLVGVCIIVSVMHDHTNIKLISPMFVVEFNRFNWRIKLIMINKY